MGEGEESLLELIEANGENLDKIKGLIYRDCKKIIFNGLRTKLLDLDKLPFPAYEKLKGWSESYKLPVFNYPKAPNATANATRGVSISICLLRPVGLRENLQVSFG